MFFLRVFYFLHHRQDYPPPFIFIDLSITNDESVDNTRVPLPTSAFSFMKSKGKTRRREIELWQVKRRFVTETFLTYFESTRFSPARIFNGGRGVNYYGSRMYERKILNEKDLISWGNIIAVPFRNLPSRCQVFLGR